MSPEGLGEFLITEIVHTVSEDGYYSNRFRAVPSVTHTLPCPCVSLPVAETQMATVIDNCDPLGRGLVRVRMNWQTGGGSSILTIWSNR